MSVPYYSDYQCRGEHLLYLADLESKGFMRLTVKDIKDKFWNPITKKGSPINIFSEQEFSSYTSLDRDRGGLKMTPTGALLIGPEGLEQQRIEDWLSTGSGPYLEDDSNIKIPYYLEFEEEDPDSKSNLIRISAHNNDVDDYVENLLCVRGGTDSWYTE